MASRGTLIYGEAPESESEDVDSQNESTESIRVTNIKTESSEEEAKQGSLFSLGSSNVLSKLFRGKSQLQDRSPNDLASKDKKTINSLPLLHRTLHSMNQQLYHSIGHLRRHPYDKASKDLHSLSQRLVDTQKIVQDIDNNVMKIKKDLRENELNISTIPWDVEKAINS